MKKKNAKSHVDRSQYPAIFGDQDTDGIPDADDPRPMTPGDVHSIEEVRLADELGALIDAREAYVPALDDVKDDLMRIGGRDSKVLGRVKTPYSMINKLRRKRLGTLTDVAGAMLVVPDKRSLDKAAKEIERRFEIVDRDDYYAKPLAGYRALHFIVKKDGLPVEIQLKTSRMKKISSASHTAYKNGELDAASMDRVSSLAEMADAGDAAAAEVIDPILEDPNRLRQELGGRSVRANPEQIRLASRLARGASR